MASLNLKKLLAKNKFPRLEAGVAEAEIKKLQLNMLRIQQGIFHSQKRALILFEGFDAAGKGGAIQRITQPLDPRGFRVHAYGPPSAKDQGRHYLYRFWKALPPPGNIAVFDRTWYGRVLVERVNKLTAKERWHQAYDEIRSIEQMLVDDGVDLIKIFLAVSAEEQLRRFEQRLNDPYKQWKFTTEDIKARAKWDDYVHATDEMFKHTDSKLCPWHLVSADDKDYARVKVLEIVTSRLCRHGQWMEKKAAKHRTIKLKKALRRMQKGG